MTACLLNFRFHNVAYKLYLALDNCHYTKFLFLKFKMSYGTVNTTADTNQINTPDIGSALPSGEDVHEDTSKWSKIRQRLSAFADRNLGLFLVCLAQTCGSLVCVVI